MSEELDSQVVDFANIDIDVDEDTIVALCQLYVENRMHPASISLYKDLMMADGDIKDALFRAVLNEMVIQALTAKINDITNPIPPFNI